MGEPNLSGRVEIDPKHLEHPTLGFLRAYWEGKRGGRPMPSRADINPSEMKQHLSWLVMLDVLEGGRDFRYRLIGDDVADYFFWNPTGKTVTESFANQPASLTNVVLNVYRGVIANRVPTYAFADAGWALKNVESCECLYVPLSDDGETINVLLQAFVFNRREVRLAREIAKANGGELIARPGG
jgi:hypothetical protein